MKAVSSPGRSTEGFQAQAAALKGNSGQASRSQILLSSYANTLLKNLKRIPPAHAQPPTNQTTDQPPHLPLLLEGQHLPRVVDPRAVGHTRPQGHHRRGPVLQRDGQVWRIAIWLLVPIKKISHVRHRHGQYHPCLACSSRHETHA